MERAVVNTLGGPIFNSQKILLKIRICGLVFGRVAALLPIDGERREHVSRHASAAAAAWT